MLIAGDGALALDNEPIALAALEQALAAARDARPLSAVLIKADAQATTADVAIVLRRARGSRDREGRSRDGKFLVVTRITRLDFAGCVAVAAALHGSVVLAVARPQPEHVPPPPGATAQPGGHGRRSQRSRPL